MVTNAVVTANAEAVTFDEKISAEMSKFYATVSELFKQEFPDSDTTIEVQLNVLQPEAHEENGTSPQGGFAPLAFASVSATSAVPAGWRMPCSAFNPNPCRV
jgi:hypothetical protein